MNNIIIVNNLSFSYKEGTKILDDVSLCIGQGELIAIVGPNGCGKSTLIKHFNGILVPSSGEVKVMGYLTTDVNNLLNIRKNVAMVFQNPDNQIVATIVEEDVAFALENLGTDPVEIRKCVDAALKMVNMYEYRNHATYQLSGGQKQRIAIACAISVMPKCIVFDEATSMLDPVGRQDILNLIFKFSKQYNITVIFVTHFMEEACLADRLIVMENGKIKIDSTPKQVFSKPNELLELGLELPKTTELCNELKCRGLNNVDKIAITIAETAEILSEILKENK